MTDSTPTTGALMLDAEALYQTLARQIERIRTPETQFAGITSGGAWLVPQTELTAQSLAERLRSVNRAQLMEMATKAKQMEKTQAVAAVVTACEQLAKVKAS